MKLKPYAPTFNESLPFWEEVRKRRNHCFLAAASWPFLSIPLVLLYSALLPERTPFWVTGAAAMATWSVIPWWVGERFGALRCYKCGKEAFTNALFFMRHAKCKHCGVKYENGSAQ